MKSRLRITQQSLFKLRLNKRYYPEILGIDFLGLKDKQGNPLTLYELDYVKFKMYLKAFSVDNFTKLTSVEKLLHLEKAKVRVTRYFSSENLAGYELKPSDDLTEIVSKNGIKLLKDGEQNCVTVYHRRIYIHPKLRCVVGPVGHEVLDNIDKQSGVIGVSHSSLSEGKEVSFAGSIVFKDGGWVLNTTSGHYITRVYQIKALLIALKDYGMDLSKFSIELWVPNDPKAIPPVLKEEDYHILRENAADYLERMSDSQSRYKLQ